MKSILLVICIFATACSHSKLVEFDSDPKGINIEVDGSYLGKTPLTAEVTRKRSFWGLKIQQTEARAFLGECSQSKIVQKSYATPDKMYFDFTKCAEKPKGN